MALALGSWSWARVRPVVNRRAAAVKNVFMCQSYKYLRVIFKNCSKGPATCCHHLLNRCYRGHQTRDMRQVSGCFFYFLGETFFSPMIEVRTGKLPDRRMIDSSFASS